VLDRGARVVLFPTGPANGRSPGDPYFDPLWARINEAGVVVAFHIMEHWYNGHIAPAWGLEPVPAPWHMSAWQWQNTYGERPITDTLSALIFDNVFGRYPNIKVLVSEFGAEWVPHFIRHMDKSRGMGRNGPWIGGKLTERPSTIFKEFVRVAPYPEDDIPSIVESIGGDASCLVMGSDFPHAEGTWPNTGDWLTDAFQGVPDDELRLMLGENAIRFFGLDRAKLAAIASRIGPTIDEITGRTPTLDPELLAAWDARGGYLTPREQVDTDAIDALLVEDGIPAATAH
jgi:predicted TIM-barrel fold metal-dependent hydrolase